MLENLISWLHLQQALECKFYFSTKKHILVPYYSNGFHLALDLLWLAYKHGVQCALAASLNISEEMVYLYSWIWLFFQLMQFLWGSGCFFRLCNTDAQGKRFYNESSFFSDFFSTQSIPSYLFLFFLAFYGT